MSGGIWGIIPVVVGLVWFCALISILVISTHRLYLMRCIPCQSLVEIHSVIEIFKANQRHLITLRALYWRRTQRFTWIFLKNGVKYYEVLPPFPNISLPRDFTKWLHTEQNEWIYTLNYVHIHPYVVFHLKCLKRLVFRNGGSMMHDSFLQQCFKENWRVRRGMVHNLALLLSGQVCNQLWLALLWN